MLIQALEASASLAKRRVPDLRRCSITWVDSPVSMALELATARIMRLREITTLPVAILRTIGRVQRQINCSNYNTTSRPGRASYRALLQAGSGRRSHMKRNQKIRHGSRLWMQSADSERLEEEIKRNLGGLGYEC